MGFLPDPPPTGRSGLHLRNSNVDEVAKIAKTVIIGWTKSHPKPIPFLFSELFYPIMETGWTENTFMDGQKTHL